MIQTTPRASFWQPCVRRTALALLVSSLALVNTATAQKGSKACVGCAGSDDFDINIGDSAGSCPNGTFALLIDMSSGECRGQHPNCDEDPCTWTLLADWNGFPQGTTIYSNSVQPVHSESVDATGAGVYQTPVRTVNCGGEVYVEYRVGCQVQGSAASNTVWVFGEGHCTDCKSPTPAVVQNTGSPLPTQPLEESAEAEPSVQAVASAPATKAPAPVLNTAELMHSIVWSQERRARFMGMHCDWLELGNEAWVFDRYGQHPTPEQMLRLNDVSEQYRSALELERQNYADAYQVRLIEKFLTRDFVASTTTTKGLPRRETRAFSTLVVATGGWGFVIRMSENSDPNLFAQREALRGLVAARDREIQELLATVN